MVLKTTNNGLHAANGGKPNRSGKPTNKKGSRVTDARAQAQRSKLATQATARQQPEAEQTAIQVTQNKRPTRQEVQAKRRVIETLIEAYIQDHIGGNHSEKTVEWHRMALGLMHLFLKEELDIPTGCAMRLPPGMNRPHQGCCSHRWSGGNDGKVLLSRR